MRLLVITAALVARGVAALPQQTVLDSLNAPAAFNSPGANAIFDTVQWRNGGEGAPSPFPPSPTPGNETGVGHFSETCRAQKVDFLAALKANQASDWILVMGNEAGDLDSMTAALALAYTFAHDRENPRKAVALLQTEQDGLYLRPENSLALHYAKMATHHRDLLTIDELPIKPSAMGDRLRGLALVDHNVALSTWVNSTVVAIVDHHADRNKSLKAIPRIVEVAGSSTSLVARYMFERLEIKPGQFSTMHGKLPHELVELMLRTIAIDTSGLKKSQSQAVDVESAERLFALSSWQKEDMKNRLKDLDDELSKVKKNLDDLDVRALLRRDWKGDTVETKSSKYPRLALGFASAPVSLEEQIMRTPEGTSPEWFAIERAWTSEISADVSVCLTNYKDEDGVKTREIALVVAHGYGKRLSTKAASSLFHALEHAIETAGVELTHWKRPDGKPLLPRRAIWTLAEGADASRKYWRPLIEEAARNWQG